MARMADNTVLAAPGWFETPHILLQNESDYIVSYTVVQELEKVTYSRKYGVEAAVARENDKRWGLNGVLGDKFEVEAAREKTSEEVILYDYRQQKGGRKEIPFPAQCKSLRVTGRFKAKGDNEWTDYKDSVYTNAKNVTLTALNDRLQLYTE